MVDNLTPFAIVRRYTQLKVHLEDSAVIKRIAFVLMAMAAIAFLPLVAPAKANEVAENDRKFLSETFDGVWVIAATEEAILMRAEPTGLAIIVGGYFLHDVGVTDIDRDGRAVTVGSPEGMQITFTRYGDYLKMSGDDRIYRAERSRRLSPADHETLNIYLNPPMAKCGAFNQRCF